MKVLLLCLVCLLGLNGAWADETEVLKKISSMTDLSGIVMIGDGRSVHYQQSFGFADHAKGQPIDEHTLFPLASLTKPFTALAVSQLADHGKLSFDDPVSCYLSEFAPHPTLTIRNLLEHRSGLVRDLTDTHQISPYEPISTEALIDRIADALLQSEPGRTYSYSNANYQVLAALVEVVSQQSYEAYLMDHIFNPSGMTSTHVLHGFAPAELAKGHAGSRLLASYHFSHAYGSGNLASTAADLHRFVASLACGLFGPPSALLGWMHGSLLGHRYIEHTGHLGSGYATCLRYFWEDDLAVIVLLNTLYPDILEVVDALGASALQMEPREQNVRVWKPAKPMFEPVAFQSDDGQTLVLQIRNNILTVIPQTGRTVYLQQAGEGGYHDPEHPLFTHHLIADENNTLIAYEVRGLVRTKRYFRVE